MKKNSVEEAIKRGYNSKKVTQIAKEELGDNTSRRRIVKRVEEAKRNIN